MWVWKREKKKKQDKRRKRAPEVEKEE